jgi:alpha-tubulin suppressor-like RCC1 family protein
MTRRFFALLIGAIGILASAGAFSSQATQLRLTAASPATAGSASNLLIEAVDASGAVDTAFQATVRLSSTDPAAVLPADYAFSPSDAGAKTLQVTFKSAGSQTVTAQTLSSAILITGTSSAIAVAGGAAKTLQVSAPAAAGANIAITATVTAKDEFGNVSGGYAGTVAITSSDPAAVLPPSAPLSSGVGTFSITLKTVGSQTVTATDSVSSSITGQSGAIQVSEKTPQTIAFASIATQEMSDLKVALVASASSGLPVSFSSNSSIVCRVEGAFAVFVAAGSCTITANQVGDATYAAASPVTVTFVVKDLTPGTITFTPIDSAPLGVLVFSNAVRVSGISEPVDITISNGEYSDCQSDFVTTPAKVPPDSLLCVRHLSAATPLIEVTTTVNVGRVSATFKSKTEPPDTDPDQFRFTNVTGVELNAVVTSLPVPIQGINTPAPISVEGGEYSIGCTATFTTAPATVSKGVTVCVRHTSSGAQSNTVSTTLRVGSIAGTFVSLTKAGVDPFAFAESLTRIPGVDNVTRLIRDPTTPSRVFALTASGLAVSEDAGISWRLRGPGSPRSDGVTLDYYPVSDVAVDSATPGTWYVAATGSMGPVPGGGIQIYRTTNYGETWTSMGLEGVTGYTPICLGVNPGNPDHIAMFAQSSIWRTANGGGSWTKINPWANLNEIFYFCQIGFAPSSPDTLLLILKGLPGSNVYSVNVATNEVLKRYPGPLIAAGGGGDLGANFGCVLTAGGGVKCWGLNMYGMLGDGTTASRSTPVDVSGFSGGVAKISAGGGHTCGLTTEGGVKCLGYNPYGQLGDGTTTQRLTPVPVSGLSSGVAAITAGDSHTCALTESGAVKCWGSNAEGRLGDGTATDRSTPVDVWGLSAGVGAISAGGSHTCAMNSSGGVKCWGGNSAGQRGDGTTTTGTTTSSSPVDVVSLSSGVAAISAGGSHTCALTSSSEVKCWGNNSSGQLGDGTTTSRSTPVKVLGLSFSVSAIAAGGSHTCVLTTNGGVMCWGRNDAGQLGDGTTTSRSAPVHVSGLSIGVAVILAGDSHTCALTISGEVKCWGQNYAGQLGDGTTTSRSTPVAVVTEVAGNANAYGQAVTDSFVRAHSGIDLTKLWLAKLCADVDPSTVCSADLTTRASETAAATWSEPVGGSLGITPTANSLYGQHSISDFVANSWIGSKLGLIVRLPKSTTEYTVTVPGIFESLSRGASWQSVALPPGTTTPNCALAVPSSDTSDDGMLFVATERGIYRKSFGEDGWTNTSLGLKAPTIRAIGVSRAVSSTILVGTAEAGAYLSTNGGNNWAPANNGLPTNPNIASTCFDSGSDSLGYAVISYQDGTTTKSALYRTLDRATTWVVPTALPALTNVRSVFCPNGQPQVVYAGGSGGLFTLSRSTNAGVSWTNVSGLDGAAVVGIQSIPGTTDIYVIASTGIFKSSGANAVAKVGAKVLTALSVSPTNPSRLYALQDGNTIVASSDGGLTWTSLPSPSTSGSYMGGNYTAIAAHPSQAGVLFVASSSSGVHVSFNDGATWTALGNSQASRSIYSLDLLFAGLGKSAMGASKKVAEVSDSLLVVAGGADGYVSRLALSTPGSINIVTNVIPASAGTVSCSPNPVTYGGASTCTATPNSGYVFSSWSGDCTGTVCVLTNLSASRTVTANFSIPPPGTWTLSVTRVGTGTGVVTSAPAGINCGSTCSAAFASSSTVTLTAVPASGSAFSGWSGACSGSATCSVTMSAAKSVTAAFGLATSSSRLGNISTRGLVLTGNDVMIGGFIIGGSAPKKVLITARGPSLGAFGVTGALADPKIELYSGQTIIAANDNWQTDSPATIAEIQATGIAPSNPLEAALMLTLNPGAYTVIVSGVSGTGVGIVEVFEQDKPEIPLLNISTRGQVQTGGSVMIGGFVIHGDGLKTVLLTARGPSLAAFGITNPLANPKLEIFSGQTKIYENDNWKANANQSDIAALGIFPNGLAPSNDNEAALLVTLPPGAYTAIVSGADGGTGVGIVEVFAR